MNELSDTWPEYFPRSAFMLSHVKILFMLRFYSIPSLLGRESVCWVTPAIWKLCPADMNWHSHKEGDVPLVIAAIWSIAILGSWVGLSFRESRNTRLYPKLPSFCAERSICINSSTLYAYSTLLWRVPQLPGILLWGHRWLLRKGNIAKYCLLAQLEVTPQKRDNT